MPRQSACTKLTKFAFLLYGFFTPITAREASVSLNFKEGVKITGNCGNIVQFQPGQHEFDLANCYHADGSYFNPCKGFNGMLQPGIIDSVLSLNPDETYFKSSALTFSAGEYHSLYSCDKQVKIIKDVMVDLGSVHHFKASQIAVSPDGNIYNNANGKKMGELPKDSYLIVEKEKTHTTKPGVRRSKNDL